MTEPIRAPEPGGARDPELEGFLALLAARRSPRTNGVAHRSTPTATPAANPTDALPSGS